MDSLFKNKQFDEQEKITTSELAEQLGTKNNVILDCAKRCGIQKKIKNGTPTYWDEEEVTFILEEFKKGNRSNNRSFQLTERLEKTKTSISIKENFLKATKDYIDLLESEKQQLQIDLQQEKEKNIVLEKKQNDYKFLTQKRMEHKELFTRLNKAIRCYSIINKIPVSVSYNYFYKKLETQYCFQDTINMSFLKKYPKYAKELLDIVLSEIGDGGYKC